MNIGLMAIALIAAFILPFEVFLFSYAFLGPAHYLTEISWLHDRNYYAEKKNDYIILAVISVLLLIGSSTFAVLHVDAIGKWSNDLIFAAFGMSLIFVLTKKTWNRVFSGIALLAAVLIFHKVNAEAASAKTYNWHFLVFTVYMPTLIHVYIFTGLFMIYGSLKRGSVTGYFAFAFFILCAISCFVIPFDNGYTASAYARKSYGAFTALNQFFLHNFGGTDVAPGDVFTNGLSITVTRFIAFAYTYHYLNWFSKTKLIQWHKVSKPRLILVIVAWIASVTLYAIDYALGFQWVFLLSFSHVVLEFPLNHRSIIGIGQEISKRFRGSPQSAASGAR